jgi:signal transduction histidine kinase
MIPLEAQSGDKVLDSVAYNQLFKHYADLYHSFNRKDEFYEASAKLQDYYRKINDIEQYYKIRLNEVMYETNRNSPYQAIKKANKMMEDMRSESAKYYNMVYTALGVIFKSRGNYRMSDNYFREALKNVSSNDTSGLLDVYKRLAYLKMYNEPNEARTWNERYAELIHGDPYQTQVYLTIKAVIDLSSNDKEEFEKVYREFKEVHREHIKDPGFGMSIMEIINAAMKGNYEEAIRLTNRSTELSELEKLEVKMDIYLLDNNYRKALMTSEEKNGIIDSLNSNMLFDNINEINAELNLYKMKQAAAKKMERMAIVIIVLSFLIIIVLVAWIFRHRKMRRHLLEKNEQLKTALEMAEESDRMKTEFVRQISHEIRTPLNAINGFNEILNESNIQVSDEERRDLVERIKENISAITTIIDELLNLSQQESGEYYTKNDIVFCNKVFSNILYSNRDKISPFIELVYTTDVMNRFTIRSNEKAITKIIDHLIQNAIKFTLKGSIVLHCCLSDDQQSVKVSVSDTGRGIDNHMRDKIFEQFFKIDHFKQGMGLGLTVSKKIAQKLGGDLELDESYTDGSRFVLTLPVS